MDKQARDIEAKKIILTNLSAFGIGKLEISKIPPALRGMFGNLNPVAIVEQKITSMTTEQVEDVLRMAYDLVDLQEKFAGNE